VYVRLPDLEQPREEKQIPADKDDAVIAEIILEDVI